MCVNENKIETFTEDYRMISLDKKDRGGYVGVIFQWKYRKCMCFLGLIMGLFMLAACEKNLLAEPIPYLTQERELQKKLPSGDSNVEEFVLPIQVNNGDFYTVSGWLDDHTLLYISELSHGSNVYAYDLTVGSSKLLYESNHPIISLEISPSKEYFLVHSSPASNKANIAFVNNQGEELFSKEIVSAEIEFRWNQFNKDSVLVTSFKEDWTFNTFLVNISDGSLTQVEIPQPFAYWIDESSLVYLDWDEDAPSLFASLELFNIREGSRKKILPNLFQVDSFGEHFLTISVQEENQEKATYTFYSDSLEEIYSFTIPHLSRFSDWLIPYYDYLPNKDTFITFQPLYYTEADIYEDGFQLALHNVKSNEEFVLLEGMQNEPISCSPNGELCLYGYYFEKLLNLETKEIIPIVTT